MKTEELDRASSDEYPADESAVGPPPYFEHLDRRWVIDLTYGDIEDLQNDPEIGIDLLGHKSGDGVGSLLTDPTMLFRVLWACLSDQAGSVSDSSEPIDFDRFRRSFKPEAAHEAWDALRRAVIRFTRGARGQKVASALEELIAIEVESLDTMAESMQEQIRLKRVEIDKVLTRGAAKSADQAIRDLEEAVMGTGTSGS